MAVGGGGEYGFTLCLILGRAQIIIHKSDLPPSPSHHTTSGWQATSAKYIRIRNSAYLKSWQNRAMPYKDGVGIWSSLSGSDFSNNCRSGSRFSMSKNLDCQTKRGKNRITLKIRLIFLKKRTNLIIFS